tara:strand:- start:1142 stop:1546 length:405 start_codon:yes stop_codon:yes gene_type:complete
MSPVKLGKQEIDKVNIYLDMIRQYNAEMQSVIQNDQEIQNLIQSNDEFQKLDYTVQKTNQSLKSYIDSVISTRNGQTSASTKYVLNVDNYTLEPMEEDGSNNATEGNTNPVEEKLPTELSDSLEESDDSDALEV